MNRYLKKLLVLVMAAMMLLSISVNAFAENGEDGGDEGGTTPTEVQTKKNADTNITLGNEYDPASQKAVVSEDAGNSITLVKKYFLVDKNAADATPDDIDKLNSPEEDFVFTITPYGCWNAGSSTGEFGGTDYNLTNMPLIGKTGDAAEGSANKVEVTDAAGNRKTVVTIKAAEGTLGKVVEGTPTTTVDLKQQLTLAEYKSVGDYWYEVEETNNKTTGVKFATNDAATIDCKYYIHVQVVNDLSDSENPKLLRSVTIHKTAPCASGVTNAAYNEAIKNAPDYSSKTDAKVDHFENTYSEGALSITKVLKGNAVELNRRFAVTVKFTKPAGTVITSDITFVAAVEESGTKGAQVLKGQDDADSKWVAEDGTAVKSDKENVAKLTNTVTVWLAGDDTVTFQNIPYGVTYEFNEADYHTNNDYQYVKYTVTDGDSLDATSTKTDGAQGKPEGEVKGEIDDNLDAYTITNERDRAIDVGVITDNAPYIALIIVAAAAAVIYSRRRKSMIEE